jgi:toxin YoeB
VFHPEFREDLRYWVETDRRTALRIFELIEAILRDPFTGIGKPEPLKYALAGAWSRRINQEHRLVYGVSEAKIDPDFTPDLSNQPYFLARSSRRKG